MSKLWRWFDEYEWAAIQNHDVQRQELVSLHHRFWQNAESNPEYTLLLMEQGIALAKDLNEPCWELFHGYWRAEVLLFYLDKMALALEAAVALFTKTHDPACKNCPINYDIHRILIDAYVYIDPLGYEDEIRAGIAEMEDSAEMDDDTRRLLYSRRVELEEAHDDYDAAIREAAVLLAMSEGDSYRQTHAYRMLAYAAFCSADYKQAEDYANQIAYHARVREIQGSIAMAGLWKAYFAQRKDETQQAETHYRQAMARMNKLGVAPGADFYDIACAYHEVVGDLDKALALRDKQLAKMQGKGSHHDEALCRLARLRLLKTMQKEIASEVEQFHQHLLKLRKPASYLEKLKKITA